MTACRTTAARSRRCAGSRSCSSAAREDTYKVKAFRGAAAAILPLGDDAVRAAVEAGTLTDLPGRGGEHREGDRGRRPREVPERLAELEAEHGGPLTAGGQDLRAALRGDLHSHSDWSDGGSPIEEMAFTAIELGHEYLVLTDHSPRLQVANGLSRRAAAPASSASSTRSTSTSQHRRGAASRLLKGIEVDILDDGSLDQTDELLAQLDVRVASVHSKLAMDAAPMTKRMVGGGPQPAAPTSSATAPAGW